MDVSCNLTTFKFFVRVPPGLYCHPIERAYCQVKPERIETRTGGAPGAGSGIRGLLGPGRPRPSPEGAGKERGRSCRHPPGRDNRHRFHGSCSLQSSPGPAERGGCDGAAPAMGAPRDRAPLNPQSIPAAAPWLRHHRCGQERHLPRVPAVPPASLLRWFSLNPEKEGPPLLSSHPRPLHLGAGSRLSPVALFSAHFGSSGARFPSRERAECWGAFLFSFLSLSPDSSPA